ncbi:MAG: xanthine dehydrogenase molybdenum-binding subunit XdhA [Desulfobacteraceae bacterium 4572_87]|nr:MAG: xanthine dehydrogenase molybdenum-binding subunit XdhA [Desulfobacteraceae bacterium 4572_87]
MVIGTSLKRVDALAKATGRALYADDFPTSGVLVAKCFRSAIAHGHVKSIDIHSAQALSGVIAVFTYEDVPATPFATAGHPLNLDPDHEDVEDRLILTRDIRFYGDEIAVVVAESEACAQEALGLIRVEYEVYEPLLTPESILSPVAREIHPGSHNIVGEHAFQCGGDVQQVFQESDLCMEAAYQTRMVQACQLENHAVLAHMKDVNRITLVTATQIPQIVRRIVGKALDIPWHQIRVIKPHVGGGFGNKQDAILEPLAAFLTLKLGGRAVRISLSREESFSCTRNRHPFHVHIATGVNKDGTLTATKIRVVSNTGGYASHGHAVAAAGGAKACSLYPRAAIDYEGRTLYSNMPVAGAMRAYGTPQTIYAIECNMEDAARKIGMDSVEFRLKNVAVEGDVNPLSQNPLLSCGIKECLIKGREWIRWEEKKQDYANWKRGPIRKGLGVACFSYASGTYPVCVEIAGTRLVLNPDGSVGLQVGAVEIGQGSDTVAVQMAAETIGVPCGRIQLASTHDTDFLPFDSGAYASRQAYVLSNVISRASLEFKNKILCYASMMTKIPQVKLDVQEGVVIHTGEAGEKVISLAALAENAYYHKEQGGQITTDMSHKTTTNAPCFGCTFVGITVDVPLCRVHIHDIINVHDSGVILNPVTARGQVHGGIAMGIGAALYEELQVDGETGYVQNGSFSDYKIPTALDVPNMGCEFVETFEPTSGYGNKALGEPPVISPPPAIRNAILDATGVAINELPLTPQILFKHFRRAGLV